jgi:hypothetical protein
MDDILELVETLVEFWPCSVVVILTFGLALWSRTRRHAHLPLLIAATGIAGYLSFQGGDLERVAALSPRGHRCGLPFAMLVFALFAIVAYTLITGLLLLILRPTRPTGVRILGRGLLWVLAASVGGWSLGRYELRRSNETQLAPHQSMAPPNNEMQLTKRTEAGRRLMWAIFI